MPKRKNYSIESAPHRAPIIDFPEQQNYMVVVGDYKYDLNCWRSGSNNSNSVNKDDLVAGLCLALNRMSRFASPHSIRSLCRGALPPWFQYLDYRLSINSESICRLSDISREILENYAAWLLHRPAKTKSGRHSYSGARAVYSQLKSILLECISMGSLSMDCIPDNPFPNSNRASISHKPYTKEEMRRLLAALGSDLIGIRKKSFEGTVCDRIAVYFLLIAARTGRNPTPLFELARDALRPHPLKPESHALLTTYKRRGNNIAVQSLKSAKQIEDGITISADVATLFYEVREFTEEFVCDAPNQIKNNLWLFARSKRGKYGGGIGVMNAVTIPKAISRFVDRHELFSDEIDPESSKPKPFQLTIMRLRKTFATRMWQLTGGDIVRTAYALGNQPPVTDTHYLAITPNMIRNHRFVGKCLEADLRGKADDPVTLSQLADEIKVSQDEVRRILTGKYNTGVGKCSSPLYGKYAPNDGIKACTAFLSCFDCPNQVIVEDDLYRLFSFYWLLIKERNTLPRNQWHKMYGWVIREIDNVISPRFSEQSVRQAREQAHVNPHPMWRDRSLLGGN